MRILAALAFAVILFDPFGGGKIPAIGQGQGVGLDHHVMLGIAVVVSFISATLFTLIADLIGRTLRWLERFQWFARSVAWARRQVQRFRRQPEESGSRLEGVTHPGFRYATIAVLPLLPAGGGSLLAIALAETWGLNKWITVPILGVSGSVSFWLTLTLVQSWGYLPVLAGVGAFAVLLFAGEWILVKYRQAHPAAIRAYTSTDFPL